MKPCLPATSARASNRSGFTLIEILTALTVLSLMLLMVNQLINSAAAVMTVSSRHLDEDTEARLIFNRMEVDFEGMLKRPDLDYGPFKNSTPVNAQAGNDQLAFYSETHGYFSGATQPLGTGKADSSLVAYMVNSVDSNGNPDATGGTPVLERLAKGLGWEPSDSSASPAWDNVAYLPITLVTGSSARWPNLFNSADPDPDYRGFGTLVFRIEYTYLLKATSSQAATLSTTPYYNTSGHTSIDGFKDVAAIVVTIAMLDNSGRLLVKNYPNLISAFPDAVNPASDTINKGDVAAAWNAVINSPAFATSVNIPKTAASSVRVYERYFYLDSPQ